MNDKDKELKENIKFLAKCCNDEYNDIRIDALLLGSIELINRQQADIENLKIENQSLRGTANSYKLHYNEARAEAVKEFAERLKDRIVNFQSVYPIESATLAFLNGSSHRQLEILEIIDNLVKEMAGDTE